jgi:hypothetical protein
MGVRTLAVVISSAAGIAGLSIVDPFEVWLLHPRWTLSDQMPVELGLGDNGISQPIHDEAPSMLPQPADLGRDCT